MEIEHKNQNNNNFDDITDLFEIDYVYENKPIKRTFEEPNPEKKQSLLENLKQKILEISDCELKKNSSKIVFSDGDANSSIMIIGEGPGQKEDEMGKPFVGDAGILLNRMLEAIKIKRPKVYITNVVNYRPPNNRKPEPSEINRYSVFLREHINIIDPKILILMGSTAMEALFGQTLKISKERGKWKELIVNQKTYLTILTFHPAYLLRQPDQKKFSWSDLKMIREKIDELKINI
jgi:DNA polymerase